MVAIHCDVDVDQGATGIGGRATNHLARWFCDEILGVDEVACIVEVEKHAPQMRARPGLAGGCRAAVVEHQRDRVALAGHDVGQRRMAGEGRGRGAGVGDGKWRSVHWAANQQRGSKKKRAERGHDYLGIGHSPRSLGERSACRPYPAGVVWEHPPRGRSPAMSAQRAIDRALVRLRQMACLDSGGPRQIAPVLGVLHRLIGFDSAGLSLPPQRGRAGHPHGNPRHTGGDACSFRAECATLRAPGDAARRAWLVRATRLQGAGGAGRGRGHSRHTPPVLRGTAA